MSVTSDAEGKVPTGGELTLVEACCGRVPVLEANGGGIVNVLSLLSLASTPPMTGYSASKAAAHSLTQALRPVLAERGIRVHGVYPAGIDTDMTAGVDTAKTAPAQVAAGLLDGLVADQEDIFPDPNAQAMAPTWWSDPQSIRARILRRGGRVTAGHPEGRRRAESPPPADRNRRHRTVGSGRSSRPMPRV